MLNTRALRAIEAVSVFLFLLRGLRMLFSTFFGILYDEIFAGSPTWWLPVSVILVVLAFWSPVVAKQLPTRRWMMALAVASAAASLGLCLQDATARFFASLLTVAAGGMYLAGLMTARRMLVLPSLVLALALDQVLRALGDTYDLGMRPAWLPFQLVWAGLVVFFALFLAGRSGPGETSTGVYSRRAGAGIGALLFLEASLLALPNAVSNWTNAPYFLVAPVLVILTLLPLLPSFRHFVVVHLTSTPGRRALMAAALAGTLLLGYFDVSYLALPAMALGKVILLAFLVLLIDGRPPVARPVATPVAVGMLVFLGLNVLSAFTFTYPYTLPVLRGLGWAVYLLAAMLLGWAALHQRPGMKDRQEVALSNPRILAGVVLAVAAVAVVSWPRPAAPLPQDGSLKLATYNMHYGYDQDWNFNLPEMADLIEAQGVDAIALQEVDTGRLTSFAVDDAYYLGRQLSMRVAYLPTTEHLTGIALLYKGESVPVDTMLLTSLQEQTGIIHAPLRSGTGSIDAYAIWMGLEDEDTERQIAEALAFIGDSTPASFGGDFNAEMGTPVTDAVLAAGFEDPFAQLGFDPAPPTSPGAEPQERIDYVWLRGAVAQSAWVPESDASDHRMVVVEVALP